MDTPSLLGAALAFSVVALPLILYLYTDGVKKSMLIVEQRIEIRIKTIEENFNKVLNEINHKKVSIEQLDRISGRLSRILDKVDPNNNLDIYD